jgi:hypothetical protein
MHRENFSVKGDCSYIPLDLVESCRISSTAPSPTQPQKQLRTDDNTTRGTYKAKHGSNYAHFQWLATQGKVHHSSSVV